MNGELKIEEILLTLNEIKQDQVVPKNVRVKISSTIDVLSKNDKSIALKINQSLENLEEISDDPNIPTDTRGKIWEIISLLSSI